MYKELLEEVLRNGPVKPEKDWFIGAGLIQSAQMQSVLVRNFDEDRLSIEGPDGELYEYEKTIVKIEEGTLEVWHFIADSIHDHSADFVLLEKQFAIESMSIQ